MNKAQLDRTRDYYEKRVKNAELQVRSLDIDVQTFLQKRHTEGQTRKAINIVQGIDAKIGELTYSLLEAEKKSPKFKPNAEKYGVICEKLKDDLRNIRQDLNSDISEKRSAKLTYITEVSFIFALPLSLYMAVKTDFLQIILHRNKAHSQA